MSTDLHEGVPHHDGNVGPTVALRPHTQLPEVLLRHVVRGLPEVQLEHVRPEYKGEDSSEASLSPGVSIWKVNVNSFFKSSPDGGVQDPGDVGGSQHQNAVIVIPDTLQTPSVIRVMSPSCSCLILLPASEPGTPS